MKLTPSMDMKKIYFILVMSVFSLTSCITTKPVLFGELDAKELERAKPYVWRELLKEYFLYVCITEGFKDKSLVDDDISGTVYFDVLPYSPEAFQEIKAYASSFVETIEPSPIMDHGGKRTVISSCIDKYKSKELDKFVKSMDKYLLKDNNKKKTLVQINWR